MAIDQSKDSVYGKVQPNQAKQQDFFPEQQAYNKIKQKLTNLLGLVSLGK